MYHDGKGTPQDYKEALKWFGKAANQGDVNGQFALGAMYLDGEGTPQNYVLAHKWFDLAAAAGDTMAADLRDTVAKLMTTEQISQAQKMVREWKKK